MNVELLQNAKHIKDMTAQDERYQRQQQITKGLFSIQKDMENRINNIVKPFVEPELSKIKDEDIDNILVRHIFNHGNADGTYSIPISFYMQLLQWRNTERFDLDDEDKNSYIVQHLWSLSNIGFKLYMFYERLYYSESDNSDLHWVQKYKRSKTTHEKHLICDTSDVVDAVCHAMNNILPNGVFSKNISESGDITGSIHGHSTFYNIYNEQSITDALIKRLTDYGLEVINTQIDKSIDKDMETFNLIYNIKVKIPSLNKERVYRYRI